MLFFLKAPPLQINLLLVMNTETSNVLVTLHTY